MPKVITAIVEGEDNELWDCAYESIDQAKADAIDYLEGIRTAEPGRWSSISYRETTGEHGREGMYTMYLYDASMVHTFLRLKPLVLG